MTTPAPCFPAPREGSAILIRWEGDEVNSKRIAHWKKACTKLKMKEYNMLLDSSYTDEMGMDMFKALTSSLDGKDKLIMVCYAGHGDGESFGILHATSREGHGIDLSAILAYARDELESHVIIVLDCCYGGLPLPSPGKFTCPSDKVVELVAAGEGVVSGLYGDFSWLVADVFEQADGEDSYRHP